MHGDIIKKDLPKYKYEAMKDFATLCHKLINPKVNDRFTVRDFKRSTYTIEGGAVTFILNESVKVVLQLYSDFPRYTIDGPQSMYSFTYEEAERLKKYLNYFYKATPFEHDGERVLKTDFLIPNESLRIMGARGTKFQQKGLRGK